MGRAARNATGIIGIEGRNSEAFRAAAGSVSSWVGGMKKRDSREREKGVKGGRIPLGEMATQPPVRGSRSVSAGVCFAVMRAASSGGEFACQQSRILRS